MALPPLPADWEDGPPPVTQFHAADQNNVELKVNENSTDIATHTGQIAALGGGGPIAGVTGTGVVDFGFNQSEIGHETWWTTAELRDILSGIKAIGATRVRFAAWWGAFEPTTRNTYDWDGLDRAFNLCEEYGLEPLPVITSPAPTYSSPTVADYANACGDLAARYGAEGTGQCSKYEIWNEANHRSFYVPFGTDTTVPYSDFGPIHYTSLLIAASNAIRAADSGAFIISVGLMSTVDFAPNDILPSTFLQGIYDNGGQDYFDAVGFHWYTTEPDFSSINEPTVDEVYYLDILACRDIMVAEGDTAKKMWITEMGYPDPELTSLVRADWQTKQIELIRELDFVESFLIYNYRCIDGTFTGDAQFGAVTNDFVKRQPYWDTIHSINSHIKTPPAGGVTGTHIADNTVTVNKISGTGTRSATTFFSGAGTFLTPAGSGGGSGADWNTNLTNIPSTFPPSAHTHDYASGVTGKPSTFTPSAHTHTVADLTGAAVVTAAEGLASSDNDTSIPTTAAVIDAIAAIPPGGGGGGSLVGYGTAVGAVTANVPFTITHNLNTRNVNIVVRRTHLATGGLTDTEPGEVIGVKCIVTTANTITLDPSENWAANEFYCVVSPMGVTDTAAPTAPTLSTTAQTESTISLSLTGSTGSIAGYHWYKPAVGGTLIATTPAATTTYVDTGLTGSTAYTYSARAFNLLGIESGPSNTVATSTTASSNVTLDTVGAGNRVTATNTITASQLVSAGSNKMMVAFVVISQNAWFGPESAFASMTLTSNLSGAMTKAATALVMGAGGNQGSIHMYKLAAPANGTHTLTLGSVPGGVGTADSIMIFSGSYHNVASVGTPVASTSPTGAATVNQSVTSATGSLVVCGIASASAITGFNKTSQDSDGAAVTGSGDFGLYGDAAGAASVNFTTTNANEYGFIGANLVKA